MAPFILDTDHVTLFQRAHPGVQARVLALPFRSVVSTIVSVEEQLRGRLKAVRRASDGPTLIAAYDRMQATLEFFHHLPILGFDSPAHERFTRLREQRIRIGTHDLRIAAIALATGGVLVTGNARDFSQVPELRLEDWSRG
ncbi:MAG TPA: type II toxin-antitoxin system VapC family toxin [Thermoanaerobaculia bacterium]